jgi:arylsulfatase A-like enzyme
MAVDVLRDRYDEFIRYCDKQFEYFISELAKRDVLKNTIIILSSDHGESFEHGYIEHGGLHLYEQVTHLPLIIKEPDQTKGRVINDLVEQIDIPATILDMAGVTVPSWMEGRSLVPLMKGESLPQRPIFSMAFENNPSRGQRIEKGTIAIWKGNYKLIHYLDKNKTLLYNLKEDPKERRNLFDHKPEIAQRLLSLIMENLKRANKKIISGR